MLSIDRMIFKEQPNVKQNHAKDEDDIIQDGYAFQDVDKIEVVFADGLVGPKKNMINRSSM